MKNYYTSPGGFVFEVPAGLPVAYDFNEMYVLRPGDADCLSTTPLLRRPDHAGSLVPWGYGDFYILGPDHNSRSMKFFRGDIGIELDKKDAIFGSGPKVKSEIDRIQRMNPTALVFVEGCLDKVRGENAPCASSISCPFLIDKNEQDSVVEIGSRIFTSYLGGKEEKKGINIVGFRNTRGINELIDELRGRGVSINASIIPELNLEEIKNFNNATKSFLAPSPLYKKIYQNIDMEKIFLPLPWGVKKSVEWLNRILSAENKEQIAPFEFDATDESLGFIGDEEDIENLKDKDGLNVFRMCRELGFNLQIRSVGKTKYRKFVTSEHDSYEDALDAITCNCVYSDIQLDERLILKNKQQFSFFDFEKGIEGAKRTRERLLRKSRRIGLEVDKLHFDFLNSGVVSYD